MGQILFRQPKKPLNKGFFMYSYMPPTDKQRSIQHCYTENLRIIREFRFLYLN